MIVAAATVAERLGERWTARRAGRRPTPCSRASPWRRWRVAAALELGPPGVVAAWLAEGRHRRLAISGHDLVAAGLRGPAVGRGLAAARAALLDGRAPRPREAQLAAALAAGLHRSGG